MLKSARVHYRPDIDGLRAVAIILVVIYHAFPSIFPGGFIGVDIFFVISGYLISGILYTEFERGDFSFLNFYARRFRRIIPALALVLMCSWGLALLLLLSSEVEAIGKHILAGSTFLSNGLLRLESGYFDSAANSKPLLHLWSLGIEEQFYVVWPVILWICFRFRLSLLWVTPILILISFSINIFLIKVDPLSTFYFLPTRFWELLFGCGVAYIVRNRAGLNDGSGNAQKGFLLTCFSVFPHQIWAFLGLLCLVLGVVLIDESSDFPGWWAVLPVFGSGVLIFAGEKSQGPITQLLSRPVFVNIGLISYPLYLWHWPLLSYAHIVNEGESETWLLFLILLVSFFLSYLTWKFLETPIRRRLFRGASKEKQSKYFFFSGFGVLLLCGTIGIFSIVSGGFPNRFPDKELLNSQMLWNAGTASKCKNKYRTSGICYSNGETPKILIWGESHAEMLLPGFSKMAPVELPVILIGRYGCPPILGVDVDYGKIRYRCSELVAQDKELIRERLKHVEFVILASRGPVYFSGEGYGIEEENGEVTATLLAGAANANLNTQMEIFNYGYGNTISFLLNEGKKVIFFVDVPEMGFLPRDCVDLRPIRLREKKIRTPCGISREAFHERTNRYVELVSSLEKRYPELLVYHAANLLCSEKFCRGIQEGKILYRDDDHLSATGSEYVAKDFFDWFDINLLSN